MSKKLLVLLLTLLTLAGGVDLPQWRYGNFATTLAAEPLYFTRVQENTTTTGTGAYTLAGALTGYQAFSVVGNGNTCFYVAVAVNASGVPTGDWEEGLGTYNSGGNTLSRTTILSSTNSNLAVNWAAGTKRIFLTIPANGGITSAMMAADAVTTTKIIDEAVTNVKLANMAEATIKGRAAGAGTGDATDLTATQATAILNNVVGDSGSGGTKGLVPAPAAGDAAAGKFLDAAGTFSVPVAGSGDIYVSGMVPIQEISPTGTGVVTFSALGSFTHLEVVYSGRGTVAATSAIIRLTFNGDTGNNYDRHRVAMSTGDSYVEAFAAPYIEIGILTGASGTANYEAGGKFLVPNYRSTSLFKVARSDQVQAIAGTTTNINARILDGIWKSTAAITSITLTLDSGNYDTGTKFTLYGLTSTAAAAMPNGSLVLLAEQTASGSATLDFTTAISSAYDTYQLEFVNLINASSAIPQILVSTDSGATYDTTNVYRWTADQLIAGGVGGTQINGGAATSWDFNDVARTMAANGSWSGVFRYFSGSASLYATLKGQLDFDDTTNGLTTVEGWSGTWRGSGAVNALRVKFSAGNITSGKVRIYGVGPVTAVAASYVLQETNGFRLTLTSGTPVTTSDVTGATTIYLSPYKSNRIAIYDGSRWNYCNSSEISKALGTLASGTVPYDVFAYDSAGSTGVCTTLAIDTFTQWASTTARTTAIVQQDGVWVKSGTPSRRYVGTFMPTATTTTEDSAGCTTSKVGGKRFLYNVDNQVQRSGCVFDGDDTWPYTATTIRQANAEAGNKVEAVFGLTQTVRAEVNAIAFYLNNTSGIYVGVGLDSTTAWSGRPGTAYYGANAGTQTNLYATYVGWSGLGYHSFVWLEAGGGGTTSFVGDNGGSPVGLNTGLTLTVIH